MFIFLRYSCSTSPEYAPKVERARGPSIIDPYLPFIHDTLKQYPTLTAARIYQMARERGYPGGPSHFRQWIAQLRPRKPPEAYLRYKPCPVNRHRWTGDTLGICRLAVPNAH